MKLHQSILPVLLSGALCAGGPVQASRHAPTGAVEPDRPEPSAARSIPRATAASCQAWRQGGPESDASGKKNINFPEASDTTYWVTTLDAQPGSSATIAGRFPFGRYTGLQIYEGQNLVDHLDGEDIEPDPGEDNPYVSGRTNGAYTAYVVFAPKPSNPAPNTLYAGDLTKVFLVYRVYHTTDPGDPAGNRLEPILPVVSLDGTLLETCPVEPFLSDIDATAWMRLDQGDWIGTAPSTRDILRRLSRNPPSWTLQSPYSTDYFPNGANVYMSALLSRGYLRPYAEKDLYVVRFKAPTFPDTRSGEPVYADRQVRFWSLCSNEPKTTNVNRCLADDEMRLDPDGFATVVVSDPGRRPSDAAMAQFHANWLAWGALKSPTDVVYDRTFRPWGVDTSVHFYNVLIYRQTQANPSFAQSFANVSKLPRWAWTTALGPYAPVGRYCSTADFEARGAACGD